MQTDKLSSELAQAISILEPSFAHDGFAFEQLQRVGDVALFVKRKGRTVSYEVVRVQKHPARIIFGKSLPPREAMPSNETWGVAGWSLITLERAREKFNEVSRSRRECGFPPVRTAVQALSRPASIGGADNQRRAA